MKYVLFIQKIILGFIRHIRIALLMRRLNCEHLVPSLKEIE